MTNIESKPELLEGVQILLDRMKTNPEEFEDDYDYSRMESRNNPRFLHFAKCMEEVFRNPESTKWPEWAVLTVHERDVLMAAYINLRRQQFNKKVFDLLLREKPQSLTEAVSMAYRQPTKSYFTGTLADHALHVEKQKRHDDMLDAQRLTLLDRRKWFFK